MNIMDIFKTNWLDFLTWTLGGCMGIAFVTYLIEQTVPPRLMEKPNEALNFFSQLRKAS